MTKQPDMTKVRILRTTRLVNSVNGNPRFDITFYDGDGEWTYRTSSDCACNYDVSNFANSRELIDVWLTRAERVYMMNPSDHVSG